MSKVIPWDSIRPGMTVWEEWEAGTGTIRASVIRDVSKDVKLIHYTLSSGAEFSQETKRAAEFRYWDEEPTFEEREITEWKFEKIP